MAKNTEHYELVKPAQSDFYNVDDFNGNADIIDSALQGKVDKVSGKGLSANDYTTAEKAKVDAAVPNTRKVNGKTLTSDILLNPSDVGAAATSHSHSINDLNSGILPISRGGTGAATAAGARINLDIFNLVYPVNSIYLSISSTNPESFFGGTWVAWGQGRMPIGVGSNGSENYTSANIMGGNSTINLSHLHTVNSHTHTGPWHTHTTGSVALSGPQMPNHTHDIYISNGAANNTVSSGYAPAITVNAPFQTYHAKLNCTAAGQGEPHNHGSTAGGGTESTGASAPGTNAQLSSAQSIVSPYITCYMWRRTS